VDGAAPGPARVAAAGGTVTVQVWDLFEAQQATGRCTGLVGSLYEAAVGRSLRLPE
jgi:hypothetical protein